MIHYPHSCWTNYCCGPHLLQQQRAGNRARERSLELLDAVLEAALEVAREANGLLVVVTQIDALEEIRTPPRTTLVFDIRQQGNCEHTFDQFMTPYMVLVVRMPVVLLELVRGEPMRLPSALHTPPTHNISRSIIRSTYSSRVSQVIGRISSSSLNITLIAGSLCVIALDCGGMI